MTSHNPKPQNLHHASRNEEKNGVTKNDGHNDYGIGLIINQLRQEFHNSLDLNYLMLEPNQSEFGTPSRPRFEWQDYFQKEIGVRCFPTMAQEEKSPKLDLSLGLSLPGLHPQDDHETSNQVEISSSTSSTHRSCTSLIDLNSIDNTNNINDHQVPSLVLMGCTNCHIYVMVSEIDPKCPKCKRNIVLVDMFRHRPAKKQRKC